MRHAEPSAVGKTHASSVMRLVRSSDAASAIVTQSLTPSNESARPNLPVVMRVARWAPALPVPEGR